MESIENTTTTITTTTDSNNNNNNNNNNENNELNKSNISGNEGELSNQQLNFNDTKNELSSKIKTEKVLDDYIIQNKDFLNKYQGKKSTRSKHFCLIYIHIYIILFYFILFYFNFFFFYLVIKL